MTIKYNLVKLSKKAPTERLLFKFGVNKTTKGNFYLTKESAQEIVANWKEYGNTPNIDYNHNQLAEIIDPDAGVSAGTFELALRDDGLYATNIKWTDKAAAMIASKEYIYTSPAFLTEIREGKEIIVDILNFALTNIPATKNMDQLIAASKLNKQKELKMVTNEDNKDKEETVEAAEDMSTEMSPEEMAQKIQDLEAKLAEKEQLVLDLEAKLKEYEGQSDASQEEMQKLSKQVVELSAKIDTKDKEEIINRAIVCGQIFPAQKGLYLKLNKTDLQSEIEKLPKQKLLQRTEEVVLQNDEQSEIQKLSAYISAKLKK